ncbi:MAG: hypothetical protein U1E39_16800 [Planctomycetota bacterium]
MSNAALPSRSRRRTSSPRSARLLLAPLLALPLAFLAPPLQAADAPPLPPPPPAPTAGVEDTLMLGARYFDQAIAYVARGGTLGRAVDLYAHLDVKWDLEDNHHEGEQKVWFQTPDRMRTEIVAAGKAQTKILLGDKAWNILPNGTVRRVHGTPDAAPQMKQMAEDLLRVQDLTAFVTLEGLKGPGITFQFQGTTKGDGLYAGNWLKVARRAPDGRKITFWLGMETAPDGSVRATAPGVVRIDGDPATGLWTEDWIFSDWDAPRAQPRPYRYPARLQAWRIHPDPAKVRESPPSRFLFAAVNDIQINAGIPPQVFTPPAETPGR